MTVITCNLLVKLIAKLIFSDPAINLSPETPETIDKPPMTNNWQPSNYLQHARFVTDLGQPLVELLDPQPGDRILDLGCGDGVLTQKLQELGCQVIGVDASPEFVSVASALGLNIRLMDGYKLDFDNEFEAVFSNAALHWMNRHPDHVVFGVWRSLKPSGRFVGEFGGHGNVEKIINALHQALLKRSIQNPSPWHFPTVDEYQELLESQGFRVDQINLFARPTPLPTDLQGWLATFAHPFTDELSESDLEDFYQEVAESLAPTLQDSSGQWVVDYVRLRFVATKLVG